tara:strand:- start:157 stop:369 length:213 start_codon:yes stop_codon:yes gene_type:complete
MTMTEMVKQTAQGAIDKVLEKVVSRKLLVWAMATALLFTSNLESEHWLYLSALYIGGQSVIDAIVKLKGV